MMFPLLLSESKWCCHLVAIKTRSFQLNWLVFLLLVGCTVLYVERKKSTNVVLSYTWAHRSVACHAEEAEPCHHLVPAPHLWWSISCHAVETEPLHHNQVSDSCSWMNWSHWLFTILIVWLIAHRPLDLWTPTGLKYLLAVLITVLASM